jgi:hypothetical protein
MKAGLIPAKYNLCSLRCLLFKLLSPTERKFKLRFPPPEFFTEGNEGNEGGSGPAKYNLCSLRYLL